MRLREWRRRRTRSKRRKRAAEENRHEPLREFVYLDEVSVFSLLASRIGALATDFTDTESSSLNGELKSGLGLTIPGVKGEAGSSVSEQISTGTQVVRKSTVQSVFREFYGYVRDILVLGLTISPTDQPPASNLRDVAALARDDSDWAVETAQVQRGDLIEVEVELEGDISFRTSVVLSTLLEFIEELPNAHSTLDREGLVNAVTATRILEKLLAGLVPVRGRLVHYRHVERDGREYVVHNAAVEELQGSGAVVRPVYVVGVAEGAQFWRDVRRVLFSPATYRMLCRVSRDGTSSDWTPVKLLDVLESAVPPLSGIIETLPGMLERGVAADVDESPLLMGKALRIYATAVGTQYGVDIDEESLKGLRLPTAEQAAGYATLAERRGAFDSLTEALVDEFGFEPQREFLVDARTAALREVGLIDTSTTAESLIDEAPLEQVLDARYLDCEIIAIYW